MRAVFSYGNWAYSLPKNLTNKHSKSEGVPSHELLGLNCVLFIWKELESVEQSSKEVT
jgi:hypothetical protein